MTTFRFRADFDVNDAGLVAGVTPILARTHRSFTRQGMTQAMADVPVRTGHLGRSHREDPQRFVGPFHVTGGVTAHARYAAAVHEGRDGNGRRIYARNGGALHFFWHGREFFRRSVRMGSTTPRPWLLNAVTRRIRNDPRVH